ncbi:MAG: diguanylate cyclase [Patescibacteria group bacterium]
MNSENFKTENIEKETETENRETLLLEKNRKLEETISGLRAEIEKLKNDLMHDPLTGLISRQHFEKETEETLSSFDGYNGERRTEGYSSFSFLFCDIDNFKKINDTFGHEKGNDVLKMVSKIIKENVRTADMVCRWGGDEIVIGLFGANEEEAAEIAEKIRFSVEEGAKKEVTGVTLSIGAMSYEKGLDLKVIAENADKAMYWAKKEGKNKVIKYSDFLEVKNENRTK